MYFIVLIYDESEILITAFSLEIKMWKDTSKIKILFIEDLIILKAKLLLRHLTKLFKPIFQTIKKVIRLMVLNWN